MAMKEEIEKKNIKLIEAEKNEKELENELLKLQR